MTTTDQPTPAQTRPDLKPCPFCKNESHRTFVTNRVDGQRVHGRQCYGCEMTTAYYGSEAEADVAWNTRDEHAQQRPDLWAVREALKAERAKWTEDNPWQNGYSRGIDKALALLATQLAEPSQPDTLIVKDCHSHSSKPAQPDKAAIDESMRLAAQEVAAWPDSKKQAMGVPVNAQPDKAEVVERVARALAVYRFNDFDDDGDAVEVDLKRELRWNDESLGDVDARFYALADAMVSVAALPPTRDDSGLVEELAEACRLLLLSSEGQCSDDPGVLRARQNKARSVLARHRARAKAGAA